MVGYIEPHDRKETTDLIYGLKQIPPKEILYKKKIFHEFDIETALKCQPKIILVDELAHTNVSGSRHAKRYHDILELLQSGIDVYTTVNVQHLESLQDIVEGITRVKVNERIPDYIFDDADDVKFIDIEPTDLLNRLKSGKIYPKTQIYQALNNFFIIDHLIALRSIALKRCAQRMDHIMALQSYPYVKEHILVCVSASITNTKVIRNAARMAQAFHGDFTALYIENSEQELSEKEVRQLQENLKLAKHLKANIVSVYGNDIPFHIAQYSKSSAITKLVIGRSYQKHHWFSRKKLIDSLTAQVPDLDIYIIPDIHSQIKKRKRYKKYLLLSKKETLITAIILLIATFINFGIFYLTHEVTNAILIFILSSCLIGGTTFSPVYSVISAIYYIVVLNFFFIDPIFTFIIYNTGQYFLIFFSIVVVSISISTAMRKLKKEKQNASFHVTLLDTLLNVSQNLQHCKNETDIMQETLRSLHSVLNRTILFYPITNGQLRKKPYTSCFSQDNNEEMKRLLTISEFTIVQWVFENNKNAGVSTSTLSNANAFYLSIRLRDKIFGIVGISMKQNEELLPYEKEILKTLLNQIALSFESLI
jgi:two-component system sensor histidine kinase KdpD